jgi:protein-S-isoprenylcysteine O-methyltransferase Ste14
MNEQEKPPHPGVRFPPPFLFVGGLLLAWLLESKVARIRFIGGDASTEPIETAGVFLIVLGLLLIGWGMFTFARARTAILPMKSASRLVDHGPYRLTRNPMYTGMSGIYLGTMLVMNWVWALFLFPVVIWLLYRYVISREERYLLAEFGETYQDYCRRVRRWI